MKGLNTDPEILKADVAADFAALAAWLQEGKPLYMYVHMPGGFRLNHRMDGKGTYCGRCRRTLRSQKGVDDHRRRHQAEGLWETISGI